MNKDNPIIEILKNRDFIKIWIAQVCSLTSVFILIFVLIDRIYARTGSTVAVGLLMFFYYLPIIISGPSFGVLADNFDKKKIVVLATLSQALLVLLSIASGDKVWASYTIILLYSLGDAIFTPAVGAALPSLVTKKELMPANSLFILTSQGTIVIGSLLGGILIKLFHKPEYIFILIAVFLMLSSYAASRLPAEKLKSHGKFKFDLSDLNSIKETFKWDLLNIQLRQAYQFLKDNPLVLFPVLMLSLLQGLVGMVLAILPSLSGLLSIDFADSSYFLIAPTVIGALLGSYLINKIGENWRKKDLIFTGLFSVPFIFLAVAIIPKIINYPVWLVMPLCLLLGIAFVFMAVPLQTLIQENTPIDYRGRVFAILTSLMYTVGVIPMLLAATIIDILGIRSILVGGAIMIFIGAIIAQKRQLKILSFNKITA